jgi:hypothetical protein
MGSMAGTFPMPDFNSSNTITHRNFVRIGHKQFFSKKPWTPTFYQICTRKKRLNGRTSLIKHNMTMNYTPLDSSFQCASFESKKFYLSFFVYEKFTKNQKNSYFGTFLAPTPTNGVYGRNFPYAWLQLIQYNNSPQFRSNRPQTFFSKKPWTPTFYQICTRKKRLNGRSSLIKHNMTMNYTPLDSSFQCASFESKKFYLAFFVYEKFTKNQKNSYFCLFLAPTPTNGVYGRNFPYAWLQLIQYNNSPQFRSNRPQTIFFEKTMNPYLLSNLHPEKTFKRP